VLITKLSERPTIEDRREGPGGKDPSSNAPAPGAAAPKAPAPAGPGEADVKKLIDDARDGILKKQYTEALKLLDEAKKLDPGNAEIYRLYGVAFEKVGNIDKMCSSYRKFIKLSPGSPLVASVKKQMEAQDEGASPACDTSGL